MWSWIRSADTQLARLLTVGALVNDASVTRGADGLVFQGDPTETALLAAAVDAGLDPMALGRRWPRRREIPFDPAVRLMATYHEAEGGRLLCVKGAPAAVLEASIQYETRAGLAPLTEETRAALLEANRALARDGLRVLAVAWRPEGWPEGNAIEGLTFLGFVGLEDPVRAGVREAIASCATAGIRTIMLTGDQRLTAEAVGRQLGLAPESIRSRVSPQDKLDLIAALQARGRDRGHDRRRRQRCAGPGSRGHRGRHGPPRHGHCPRSRRHRPHRRQLRDDRPGGPGRPGDLREPAQGHPLPVHVQPVRDPGHLRRDPAGLPCPAPAAPDPVGEPGHRHPARDGADPRSRRARRHAPAAAATGRTPWSPGASDAACWPKARS